MEVIIKKIEKFHIQVENRDVQDVHYEIHDGKKKISSRRENFPLDAEEKTIKAALLKSAKTCEGELKQAAEEAVRLKAEAVTNKNAEKLVGATLKA